MGAAAWNRRAFLRAAGLAGLSTLVPMPSASAMAGGNAWSADFARALKKNPMLLGWRSVSADRLDCEARVEGRLPAELVGTLYRNGPAVHERFGLRYTHWFEGDGMVHAYRFDGRRVLHRGRVVMTPKLTREDEAGRRLFPGVATRIENGLPMRRPDDINTANITVLDHHGELLALWEGGSARANFLSGKGVMRACSAAHWEEYFVVCESVWASWGGRRRLGRQPRTDRRPAITTKKWSWHNRLPGGARKLRIACEACALRLGPPRLASSPGAPTQRLSPQLAESALASTRPGLQPDPSAPCLRDARNE